LTISSCRKDDNEKENEIETTIRSYTRVAFSNVIGNEPFHLDSIYTNAAGENYSAYLLKYYISHMALVNESGQRIELYAHELMDQAVPSSLQLNQVEIPNGHYTSIEFNLGVDSLHNHSGDQAGQLHDGHQLYVYPNDDRTHCDQVAGVPLAATAYHLQLGSTCDQGARVNATVPRTPTTRRYRDAVDTSSTP
jgi:hypothetical protein